MAKAREIEGLSPEQSYSDAAVAIVSTRGAELTEHAQGVLDTGDIDRVHDMRVATRRLRAALEIFEPCFPRESHRQALRDVKRLADGLGERRDRDVAIAALHGFNEQMPAADRRGIQSLIDRLRAEQADANLELAPLVDTDNLSALRQSLDELATAASAGQATSADDRDPA